MSLDRLFSFQASLLQSVDDRFTYSGTNLVDNHNSRAAAIRNKIIKWSDLAPSHFQL